MENENLQQSIINLDEKYINGKSKIRRIFYDKRKYQNLYLVCIKPYKSIFL